MDSKALIESVALMFFLALSSFIMAKCAIAEEYSFDEGNELVAEGSPTLVSGRVGQAAKLDGRTDLYHTIIDTNNWAGITLAAWVKPESLGDDRLICKSPDIVGASHIYSLGLANGKIKVRLVTEGGGFGEYVTGQIVKVGEWSHIAVTWSAATDALGIYHNGELVNAFEHRGTSFKDSAQPTVIGNINLKDDRYYHGLIDEVMVREGALSVSEIAAGAMAEPPFSRTAKFSWVRPVTRENGDPLPIADIKHYTLFANGSILKTTLTPAYEAQLSPGVYSFTVTTTDVYGNTSGHSAPVNKVVDGPEAEPTPEPTPEPNPTSAPIESVLSVTIE